MQHLCVFVSLKPKTLSSFPILLSNMACICNLPAVNLAQAVLIKPVAVVIQSFLASIAVTSLTEPRTLIGNVA